MKTFKFPIYIIAICAALTFVACGDDDDNPIVQVTCDDGVMNGDETGVDCGGTVCAPCSVALDFTGTFMQEDSMGRPGVNTVFGGSDDVKNTFNVTNVNDREAFQPIFEATLEGYFDVYAVALGADPDDVNYETNILGLDAPTFTTVLAQFDALQVAPQGETTYFNPATGAALTGRNITDDVIDISLILMFGGGDLNNLNFDGMPAGEPLLISDGVGFGNREVEGFPYLQSPN